MYFGGYCYPNVRAVVMTTQKVAITKPPQNSSSWKSFKWGRESNYLRPHIFIWQYVRPRHLMALKIPQKPTVLKFFRNVMLWFSHFKKKDSKSWADTTELTAKIIFIICWVSLLKIKWGVSMYQQRDERETQNFKHPISQIIRSKQGNLF